VNFKWRGWKEELQYWGLILTFTVMAGLLLTWRSGQHSARSLFLLAPFIFLFCAGVLGYQRSVKKGSQNKVMK
jgi:hypothetical protein